MHSAAGTIGTAVKSHLVLHCWVRPQSARARCVEERHRCSRCCHGKGVRQGSAEGRSPRSPQRSATCSFVALAHVALQSRRSAVGLAVPSSGRVVLAENLFHCVQLHAGPHEGAYSGPTIVEFWRRKHRYGVVSVKAWFNLGSIQTDSE